MILYTYAYSSASFRVRIALNLKGIDAEYRYVHLRKDGGEHHKPTYSALNPMEEVPTIEEQGRVISQSMAILEYLEETRPDPPLLPVDPYLRAKVRQACEIVNAGIHPLGNLKVMQYLERELKQDPNPASSPWYQHWVGEGLHRLEALLAPLSGTYAIGHQVTFADCCVIPQVFNAHRNDVDISDCPTLARLWATCIKEPAFANAHPQNQADLR